MNLFRVGGYAASFGPIWQRKTPGLPLILALLLLASVAKAQLNVTLEGVPDSLRVGDPMNFRLKITAPPGGHLQLSRWEDAQDQFDLLTPPDTSALQKQPSGEPVGVGFKATCYEAGEQVLQPISVRWISPDGARVDSAQTEPVIIHVQGVVPDSILALADTTQKPYKLLQPNRIKKLGVSLAEILPWILVILAAAGAFFLLRWWLQNRRKKVAVVAQVVTPPRPAHEIALEELDRLRDQRLYQAGRVKDYYVALSEIIRRYIEAQFKIPAMESTSFQLLRDVEAAIRDGNLRSVLQNLLEDADLAKFAKHQPDEEICQRDLERAYVLVRKTMPQPVSPIAQEAA